VLKVEHTRPPEVIKTSSRPKSRRQ